jgi:hypothetical protein
MTIEKREQGRRYAEEIKDEVALPRSCSLNWRLRFSLRCIHGAPGPSEQAVAWPLIVRTPIQPYGLGCVWMILPMRRTAEATNACGEMTIPRMIGNGKDNSHMAQ